MYPPVHSLDIISKFYGKNQNKSIEPRYNAVIVALASCISNARNYTAGLTIKLAALLVTLPDALLTTHLY